MIKSIKKLTFKWKGSYEDKSKRVVKNYLWI